jgi:hypothetical protein
MKKAANCGGLNSLSFAEYPDNSGNIGDELFDPKVLFVV